MATENKDYAMYMLHDYKEKHPEPKKMTTSYGVPISTRTASLTAGPRGPLLMQDAILFDELTHFDRERIAERVVHSKGIGAFGAFEVTHDITKYTKACVFSEVGKVTPMFVRFSTVAGERGSADTVRDPRGFAMKFYTEEGNWDLVGNNTPIFFIRDPILFPSFIHALKRNPATNLREPSAFWDFFAQRPEAIHQFMFLFSDRGIPASYRHMDGFGSHTFKLQNKEGQTCFCKFHLKSTLGNKFLEADEADRIAGTDPDYANRDLINAIERGDKPQWDFFIQIMTNEEAEKHKWNPFDVTKVWPHAEFPMMPVGRMTLSRNVTNYFAEVEQVAFSPSHMIPGIEPSNDKMLQGRLISYKDTQVHRLGPNYQQLPINCPYRTRVQNIQRDGFMALANNQGDGPAHHPNSFNGPEPVGDCVKDSPFAVHGHADRYESGDDDNYSQPRLFWTKVLDEPQRQRLVKNICKSLCQVYPEIQKKCVEEFRKVHEDLGNAIECQLKSGISAKCQ